MVAERQYLILFTLKCIAEPSAIYHQPPRDGDAFGLVSNQSNVHNFTLFSYVRSAQVMLLREVVRRWRVVCAPRRFCRLCRSNCCVAATTSRRDITSRRDTTSPNRRHHLPQEHYPRAACITYFSGYHICSYLRASFLRYLGISLSHSWHFISSVYIRATQ